MRPAATLATGVRVLRQLRRDPRTVALLIVVPMALLALMKWIFHGQEPLFQRVGPPLLGIFPLTSMFLVTSITMLRERVSGTLERLMTMPLSRVDLLLGYGVAFGLIAVVQAVATSLVAFGLLGLDSAGPWWLVMLLAVVNAILGTALGLFASAFARTEFQAIQFMPAFVLPQILLCGLLAPRETMVRPLELISAVMPMTYAYDALTRVAKDDLGARLGGDVAMLAAASLLALILGAATLRRRTP